MRQRPLVRPGVGVMEPRTVDPLAARQARHVAGFDTIRFVCALWVLFGHLGFLPLVAGIDRTTRVGYLIAGAFANAVSGPAAVVVFFVISGFCIHYPFRGGTPVPLRSEERRVGTECGHRRRTQH